jgi:hypothetical protein
MLKHLFELCTCHPNIEVGMGEPCLNCKLYPGEHNPPGYCRNSTRQWDWSTHRKEVLQSNQAQNSSEWVAQNWDKLEQYPNCYIALHLREGIVLASTNGDLFSQMLGGVDKDLRSQLTLFHTSIYLG